MPSLDLGVTARGKQPSALGVVNATGGDLEYLIDVQGNIYKVHEFRSSGEITFTGASGTVECFILAGGGPGGFGGLGANAGGGGGGGGLIIQENIKIKTGNTYSIVVGAGGAASLSVDTKGTNGGNSSVFDLTALGGGAGGNAFFNVSIRKGNNGGSGGGTGAISAETPESGGQGFAGPPRQGNNGGASQWQTNTSAGGGGGFTQAGFNGTGDASQIGGRGGDGIISNFTGTLIAYAGGGSGARQPILAVGASPEPNRGAGGQGGNSASGSNGTSGIVYIRYPFGFSAEGGTVVDYIEDGMSFRAHIFTESGTATFLNTGTIELLMVAGGGGGGFSNINDEAGGGGGGGLIHREVFKVKKDIEYPIIVGSGGAHRVNGNNTTAFGLVAIGGGKGADNTSPGNNPTAASSGGSGGGGSSDFRIEGLGLQSTSASGGFGNSGGFSGTSQGGGGGGAGSPGVTGNPGLPTRSQGGDGLEFSLTGTPTYYAGGGGGQFGVDLTGLGGGFSNYGGGGNPRRTGTDLTLGRAGDGIVVFRYVYLPEGQAEFTTPGTYSWTAPPGVTSVSAVCVGGGAGGGSKASAGGGGALAWRNNIPVVPGQHYTVVVGAGGSSLTVGSSVGVIGNSGRNSYFVNETTVFAEGGKTAVSFTPTAATFVGQGGGLGGRGPFNGTSVGGGGGGGGYSGAGGDGGARSSNGQNGLGGGGGGGGAADTTSGGIDTGGGGGGVGIYGEGASGQGGIGIDFGSTATGLPGTGGSGGNSGIGRNGGLYGGGGGSVRTFSDNVGTSGSGQSGAVRIIWGLGRNFPTSAEKIINDSLIAVTYLVVAGGGGGGPNDHGGGGGGGGVLTSVVEVNFDTTFSITIGAGGSAGSDGNNSAFGLVAVATGGGAGASRTVNGRSGGSGGGGSLYLTTPGLGSLGQGNIGGEEGGYISGSNAARAGGGGGAGAPGVTGKLTVADPGVGGAGLESLITGSSTYYGGGGGGASWLSSTGTIALGGIGGGGNGGRQNSTLATPGGVNTGGGGGARQDGSQPGGSGVVIIRHLTSAGQAQTTGSPIITTSGLFTVYRFNNSGTIRFLKI